MRLSGGDKEDADQGVAVAALVQESELSELQRRPSVALGHDARVRREHRDQRGGELPPERGRMAVWRVDEDEIVLTTGRACAFKERQGALPADLGAEPGPLQMATDRGDRRMRGVDQGRLRRPARERLDRERARARE